MHAAAIRKINAEHTDNLVHNINVALLFELNIKHCNIYNNNHIIDVKAMSILLYDNIVSSVYETVSIV